MSPRTISRKVSFAFMLSILVVFSVLSLQSPQVWMNVNEEFSKTTITDDGIVNTDPDQDEFTDIPNPPELSSPVTLPQKSADATSWWNEVFEFRRKITITEPNVQSRTLWPVETALTFPNNTAYKNSIRIIYFDGITQIEIPSQIYNAIYWQNGTGPITYSDFLKSVTIVFSVSITQNTQKTYYVYYSTSFMTNNYASYYTETGMSTSLTSGRAIVNNNVLTVELAEGTAIDSLKFSSGDGAGLNFHTDTSMSPSGHAIAAGNIQTYSPDGTGYIRNWLLVGPFETSSWTYSRTLDGDFVDPNLYYIDGDHATPTDPPLAGSNYALTWFDYQSTGSTIDLDTNVFGSQTTSAAYGMIYVYFPNNVANLYLRFQRSDGIRIFFDSNVKVNIHTTRSITDTQESVSIGAVSAGWHAILLMCEVNTGDFAFRLRFSSSSTGYTAIPGIVIAHALKTNIDTITILEQGPVFTKINVIWEQSSDMFTFENLTFYRGLNMYRSTRVFWWSKQHNATLENNMWSVANTNYYNTAYTKMDVYVADGTIIPSLTLDEFNAENYVLVYDNSGDNYNSAQGLFVTDYYANNVYMTLTSLNTTAYYTNYQPYIIPGYQTDMDNKGTHPSYTGSESYSVTVELWEYTNRYVSQAQPNQVGSVMNGVYNTLTTPLQTSIDTVENLFYNLKFTLYDADNFLASNVDITLYNTTTNWGGIVLPAIATQETDQTGSTTFYNLNEMNLTYVITYQAYTRPAVELKRDNITLDTSLELSIYNLNLTTLIVLLSDSEDLNVPVYGGNVSLYWNNTGGSEGTYIGYQISDADGRVQFYYLNSSEAMGNYTIKIQTYGEFRRINNTFESPASADFIVNFTLASYTLQQVSVQVVDYSTKLIQNPSGTLFDPYWGETFGLNYTYLYGPTGSETFAILNAEITYNIRTYSTGALIKSGIFTSNGTAGSYNLTFITSDPAFSLSTSDRYLFEIFALKAGFLPQSTVFTLEIQNITTGLTVTISNSSPYWLESFTVRAYYNNTFANTQITAADIVLTCGNIQEILDDEGTGWYNITLDTTEFPSSGSYTLSLAANKTYFNVATAQTSVMIQSIATNLTSTYPLQVYWEDNFTISLNFTDTYNEIPVEDAYLFYIIVGDVQFQEFTIAETTTPGIYNFTLNTTSFSAAGQKTFQVVAQKANYETKQLWTTIEILIVPTDLTAVETEISVKWQESFTISLIYENVKVSLSPTPIITGIVTYAATGTGYSKSGSLINEGNGDYSLDITTNIEYPQAGTYTYVITASKNQYETQQITIIVSVEIIPTDLAAENDVIQVNWLDNFTVRMQYQNITSISPVPIIGATLKYNVTGIPILNGNMLEEGSGWYYFEFNTTQFGDNGTYSITIKAQKSQFETQQIVVLIDISIISTSFTTSVTNLNVVWEDSFSINTRYLNITNPLSPFAVLGATVAYTISGPGAISGNTSTLPDVGNGWYNLTFDSTLFLQTGTFTFSLTASKEQYGTRQLTITFHIIVVPTNLTALVDDISVPWENELNLFVTFENIENPSIPIFITTGSVAYRVTGPNGYVLTGSFSNLGNGTYGLTFITDEVFPEAGIYTYLVNASKSQYETRQLTIVVSVYLRPTDLTVINEEISVIWGENITITAEFYDILDPLLPVAVNDGQLSYNVTGISSITGYLGSIGSGQYWVELNSLSFGSTGTYSLLLHAIKNQYESHQLVVTLHILIVPTTFSLNVGNITTTWNDNFTVSATFVDYQDNPILNGSITFSVGQVLGLTGALTYQSAGVYMIEMNTTLFNGVGTFTMALYAQKSQYTMQSLLLYITINRIETRINNSIFLTIEQAINVSTSILFYINYCNTLNIGISQAYIAYYEWQTTTGAVQSGTGLLQDLGNGVYLLDFDSENRLVGIYLLVIHIGQANYVERSGSITLQIRERPIRVVLNADIAQNKIERPEGSQILLEFSLIDPITSLPLTGATVYMEYRSNTYSFIETAPGTYSYTIDTSTGEFKALARAKTDIAQVYISKANYTISPFSLTISVTPPEFMIGNLGIPKIFVYIGGSVAFIALAAVGSWQYIIYAKIPLIIKQIERIKKIISKNKVAPDHRISPTLSEEIVEVFAEDWKLLDLDLQSIFGGNQPSVEGTDSIAPSDQPQGGI